jgi:hypothetical protein
VIPAGAVVLGAAVGESLLADVVRGLALTVLSGALGAGIGLLHRWYANRAVPEGLSVLVGLSGVALYLNTAGALGDIIGGQRELLALDAAVFNVVTFLVAGVAAAGGGRLGDRLGIGFFAVSGGKAVERDVSRIVRTVGRVAIVEVPGEIDDIEGYDPVDAATKEKLAGQRLLFPRGLTVGELRERFVERLRTDYGVGRVDVDLDDDGTVEYLAVGSREAGIGPTLPPESAAIAIRADPANNASPGDTVQVWTGGDAAGGRPPRRVTNAEVRGTAGDVVTLAMDETEAMELDTGPGYRLVTLPLEARPDREFAAQLRAAEETMGAVTVAEGSVLAGGAVVDLDVAVAAIRSPDGDLEAIPSRTRPLQAGETVYVIARPDQLRKLEAAAGPEGPS